MRAELYPRLRQLALQARRHDVGFNIDAEEADRLELSLELLERLCFEPELAGWNGIGFVVQAYQKRAPRVIEFVVDLARRSGHRLMVRLVKGAYWDALPQNTPTVADCLKANAQAIHRGLMVTALLDGSVRTIHPSLTYNTWLHALLPADGNPLGADWNN